MPVITTAACAPGEATHALCTSLGMNGASFGLAYDITQPMPAESASPIQVPTLTQAASSTPVKKVNYKANAGMVLANAHKD